MRFESRLKALERIRKELEGKHPRVIMQASKSFKVNLANSSYERTRADGLLMEMVELDGNTDGMTDAELDAWVDSFPTSRNADLKLPIVTRSFSKAANHSLIPFAIGSYEAHNRQNHKSPGDTPTHPT